MTCTRCGNDNGEVFGLEMECYACRLNQFIVNAPGVKVIGPEVDRTMSDETRAKLLAAKNDCDGIQSDRMYSRSPNYVEACERCDATFLTALTAHEQAVAGEAVLAFAKELDGGVAAICTFYRDAARRHLATQGLSLPAAERKFVGVGELERTGYIDSGASVERDAAAERGK